MAVRREQIRSSGLFAIQVRETRERLKMSQGELARQMSTRGFPYYQ